MSILIIIATIILITAIWFNIPYSPVKNEFVKDVKECIEKSDSTPKCVITKADFENFPPAIQKYIESCGYIGTPHKSYLRMFYKNVDFMQGKNGPKLKIDYTQYDFGFITNPKNGGVKTLSKTSLDPTNNAAEPCRLALIDSSMFGIPFQGYDYYKNGIGGMKGVIAKCFTLFNQTGAEMDKACLATYLAEIMFLPSALLSGYITFEEIDDYNVRATISNGGQTCSGVFTFNQNYEYISFTTNDRAVSNPDNTMENIPWSAICGDYKVSASGIKYPSTFKAVWNYPESDFVYFDGKLSEVN